MKKMLDESIADKGASKSYPLHSNNQIIEIRGVPMLENEDIYYILEEIAKALGINYNRDTISKANRLPAPRGNPCPPNILVQFTSKSTKAMWIASGKQKQLSATYLSSSFSQSPIVIYEQLTPLKKAILGLAKSYVREGLLESSSVREGEIFVRRSPDSAAVRVRSVSEVESVVGVVSGEGAGGGTAAATVTTAAPEKNSESAKSKVKHLNIEDKAWDEQLEEFEGDFDFVKEVNEEGEEVFVMKKTSDILGKKTLGDSIADKGASKSYPLHSNNQIIEIKGIPKTENEDIYHILEEIAKTLGIKYNRDTIFLAHRLPAPRGNPFPPSIVVQFTCKSTKDTWAAFGKDKRLRDLSSSLRPEQIFIVEHLTPLKKAVLGLAKSYVREGQLESSSVRQGEIFVRRSPDSAAVRVRSVSDVESVVGVVSGKGAGGGTAAATTTTGKKKKKKRATCPVRIFDEEDLTLLNRAILERAKSYVWEGSLESAWVQEGEIFVCRSQNSAAVVVRSVSEVESVVAVKDGRSGEDAGGSGSGKIVVHRSPDPAAVRVQSVSEVESVVAVKDGRSGEDAGGSGDGAAVVVATTPATTSGKKKMKKLMTTDQSPSLCSGSGGNLAVAMSTMVASTSGKKKKKKKLTTTDLSSPLVENQLPIVENLTPLNRVVLEHAKLCVREGQLASAWVQEGEVSACRSLDSAAVRLSEVESVVAVKGGRSAEDAGGSSSNTGVAIATTAASASGKKKKKKQQPRTMDLLSSLRPAPISVEENQTPLNTAVLEHPKSYAAVEKNSESAISMDKNTLNQIRLSAALRGQPGPV